MPAAPTILPPDLLTRIGNLKVHARTVVDGVLTGLHKSPHHGSSIEFAEHKEYAPGDDIRHIDWKAYARFDRYYVKKFEDETNLRCHLVVDASRSMDYGEGDKNKLAHARVLAAAFAYLLLRQQDSPGLSLFRERIESYIPPRGTLTHYQELLESLVRMEGGGKTDLSASLENLAEILRGRNLVLIFSDFFDPERDIFQLLARLRVRKNDVALFQILHGDEIDFPFDFLGQFEDPESGGSVLADPDAIREEYRRVFNAFTDGLRRSCLEHGIEYQLARTDEPPEKAMLAFLKRRGEVR